MKKILMMALLVSTFSIAHAQAVNTVCTQEAETAKCGDDKVGSGLIKCLRNYKKANKDFKLTDSCEASLKQLRRDVRAKKIRPHSLY